MKKVKIRTIDGKALYAPPGVYELTAPLESPYFASGFWPVNTQFIVERQVDKIGDQNAYEHYSLRLAGSGKFLVKSYQHKNWNDFISKFRCIGLDN